MRGGTDMKTPRKSLTTLDTRKAHLRVGVRLDEDHVTQQDVHREIPLALGRARIDIVDVDDIPVRADGRPHRPGAAHHRLRPFR